MKIIKRFNQYHVKKLIQVVSISAFLFIATCMANFDKNFICSVSCFFIYLQEKITTEDRQSYIKKKFQKISCVCMCPKIKDEFK